MDLSVYCLPLLLSLRLALASVPCMLQPVCYHYDPASPRFSNCQFSAQFLSRISPTVTSLKASSFPDPFSRPYFFFVLFGSLLCFKEAGGHNVFMCMLGAFRRGWVSDAGSNSDWFCSAFGALIETYCQGDVHICMQCVFQDLFIYFLLAAHHFINQLSVTHMQTCTHMHPDAHVCSMHTYFT